MRVGLFGGTFDPPHVGHVAAVRAALRSGRYHHVDVTVAGDPYHKSVSVSPAPLRLAMAHAAFDQVPGAVVSDREIRRVGPSYTADTVRELLANADVDEVEIIIGADLIDQLDTWHDVDDLRRLASVAVVPRPGSVTTVPAKWRVVELAMDPVDLSSTFIRQTPLGFRDLSLYLPAEVIPLYEESHG